MTIADLRSLGARAGKVAPYLVAAGVTAFLLLAPHGGGQEDVKDGKSPPAPVITTPVVREHLSSVYETVGAVEGISQVEVTSTVEGVLSDVTAAPGDRVRQGQSLAVLDQGVVLADLAQAEAQLVRSEAELIRSQQLAAEGLADGRRLEAATAQQRIDQAAVDRNRALVRMGRFPSPISGIVTQRSVERGESVRAGAALFSLADVSKLVVKVRAPEEIAARLQPGGPARVHALETGGADFPATVARVYPGADPVSRQTTIEIDAGAAYPRLRPGALVRAELVLADRPSALAIDRRVLPEALAGEAATVLIVKDGKIEPREIRLGLALDDRIEVVSGLSEGEQVVLRGGDGLERGDAVTVLTAGDR